jgi:DNA-binding XRE family transcriptional regulator
MTPKTKKFADLAAPLYADPASAARVRTEVQAVLAAMRLAELRESRGLTQSQLAEQLGVSQVNVSRIERAEDTQLSTISRYVEGLGGHLELRAIFDGEQTVPLALPATAPRAS